MLNEYREEEKLIKSVIPQAAAYQLVNNYGWSWKEGDTVYDIRHILNSYGCDCNFWDFTDSSKIGTPGCCKTFSTLEELVDYLKEIF